MHGDFSRWHHDPKRRYTAVLKQQGRVEVDADANEQAAINQHLLHTLTRDVLGNSGVPQDGGGFEVSVVNDAGSPKLMISEGRMYVDGILCELFSKMDYEQQPEYPLPTDALRIPPAEARQDVVYLDVWQRHITAVEDPSLRDAALGGPDTTTRLQTICQVKILEDPQASCDGALLFEATDATLTNSVDDKMPPDDPCIVSVGSGSTRLDNRFYRVEIHQGGTNAEATFKWSRDNGAVLYRIQSYESARSVKVAEAGRDQVLALRTGDWVELVDDTSELRREHGVLLKVKEVNESTLTVLFEQSDVPTGTFDLALHPKLRRWDGTGDSQQGIAVADGELELEDGIRVLIEGTLFNSGDYWFFATRTASRELESLDQSPPQGVPHRYAKLAAISWPPEGDPHICDCRPRLTPLATQTNLHYVSGDGQGTVPTGSENVWLCGPLQVRVLNGGAPVEGASVRFQVMTPDPAAAATLGTVDDPPSQTGSELVLKTDGTGLAECRWHLDPNLANVCQRVGATLLDCDNNPVSGKALFFNGNLTLPSAGGGGGLCTVTLGADGVVDLQDAIDLLPLEGGCVCVPSERFTQKRPVKIIERHRITIEGCGNASEIVFDSDETAPLFLVDSSTEIRFERLGFTGGGNASDFVEFVRAQDCRVKDCRIQGAEFGISAAQSGSDKILREISIDGCWFEGQRVAIRFIPEGGIVDGLRIYRNRMQSVETGIAIANTRLIRAEIVENAIHARGSAIQTWGSDLLLAGNRLTSDGERFALNVFISSLNGLVRVRENTITAPRGQGVHLRGHAAQVDFSENHVEASNEVFQLYPIRESTPEERTASVHVFGNAFRALSEEPGIPVIQCGTTDDETDATSIMQLLFTENQVFSNRISRQATTVYINAFTSLVTGNVVEDPREEAMFSMIVEGLTDRSRRTIVAHNITRNAIRDGVSSGPIVGQPNVQ